MFHWKLGCLSDTCHYILNEDGNGKHLLANCSVPLTVTDRWTIDAN